MTLCGMKCKLNLCSDNSLTVNCFSMYVLTLVLVILLDTKHCNISINMLQPAK